MPRKSKSRHGHSRPPAVPPAKRRRRRRPPDSAGWDCAIHLRQVTDGIGRSVEAEIVRLSPAPKNCTTAEGSAARAAKRLLRGIDTGELATSFSSLGHPQRLAILHRLLEGPASYQQVQQSTKLKAGPLYHHVSALRLAGLVAPKARNVYTLTEPGRRLTALSALVPKLLKAKRKKTRDRQASRNVHRKVR